MWGKPSKPMLLELSTGIIEPFCKLDVNTPRQTFFVIACIFGEQTVPQKGRKTPSKKVQTPSKKRKSGFLPWRVFVTRCCCATFGSIMVGKHNSGFQEVWETNHLTCRHIERMICLINMLQLEKFQRLDLQVHLLGKTRHKFPKTRQRKCKCVMTTTQKAKGTQFIAFGSQVSFNFLVVWHSLRPYHEPVLWVALPWRGSSLVERIVNHQNQKRISNTYVCM